MHAVTVLRATVVTILTVASVVLVGVLPDVVPLLLLQGLGAELLDDSSEIQAGVLLVLLPQRAKSVGLVPVVVVIVVAVLLVVVVVVRFDAPVVVLVAPSLVGSAAAAATATRLTVAFSVEGLGRAIRASSMTTRRGGTRGAVLLPPRRGSGTVHQNILHLGVQRGSLSLEPILLVVPLISASSIMTIRILVHGEALLTRGIIVITRGGADK